MGKIEIDFSESDFRLLDASIELDALEEHLQLIKRQMEHIERTVRRKTETYICKEGLCPDDPEWHIAWQNYNYRIDSLPRFFRGPFLARKIHKKGSFPIQVIILGYTHNH